MKMWPRYEECYLSTKYKECDLSTKVQKMWPRYKDMNNIVEVWKMWLR